MRRGALLYCFDYCSRAHCFSFTDANKPQLEGIWRCVPCRNEDQFVPLHFNQEVNKPPLQHVMPAQKLWAASIPALSKGNEEDEDEDLPLLIGAFTDIACTQKGRNTWTWTSERTCTRNAPSTSRRSKG